MIHKEHLNWIWKALVAWAVEDTAAKMTLNIKENSTVIVYIKSNKTKIADFTAASLLQHETTILLQQYMLPGYRWRMLQNYQRSKMSRI